MSIYVSTSCLGKKSVIEVLDAYKANGIKSIELGSTHNYVEELEEWLADFAQTNGTEFLVHNYFPPAKEPFILNLASQSNLILERSIEHAKNAINLCNKLGSELYTFHAGFLAEPDMSFKFSGEKVPYKTAFDTFVSAVKEVDEHARDLGVKLAIENNVPNTKNSGLVDDFLLMQKPSEFKALFEQISSDNVGMLLDFGHLKVSAHWLKFDRQEMIDNFTDKIFAVHAHDNEGEVDTHGNITENSWFLDSLSKFSSVPIVLESTGLSIEEIKKSVELLAQRV